MAERTLSVDDVREQRLLFGSLDRNLRAIRERWGVSVSARRGNLRIAGDDEEAVREVATRLHAALQRMRKKGEAPTDGEVFAILLDEEPAALASGFDGRGVPGRAVNGHPGLGMQGGAGGRKHSLPPAPLAEIRPLTENQRAYVEAIRANDVVFAIGPAGTGKTYLAVAEAVAALRSGEVRKLMLTRPAVEAGEKLGFLPGDFQAKINPYLRPLYDALEEMLRYGEVQRSIENGLVEIVPLAYMRGRTLKNAFIILDEAQNTTHAQMKMFLTRMGSGSKIVVTGDVTQMDLPEGATSGLVEAARVLRDVKGLAFVEFQGTDIIRHPMVQRIVEAYERADAVKAKASVPGTGGSVGP
jgi:phosphate starvation-inducible protein PhoH and related proteins